MSQKIQHNQNETRGIFFIKVGDKTIAEMTYTLEDQVMTIDHTEVKPDQEGKGIGSQLVEAGYAFAKANSYTINPLCPFAEVVFERHSDWQDILV